MPIVNLDFDLENVSTSNDPVPVGTYDARIAECELVTSSTGKPMLKVTWEITDGEFAGRKLFDNVVLTVDWRVKMYADVVGLESGSELVTEDFIGAEGIISVIHEEYNGEPRAKIKNVVPA